MCGRKSQRLWICRYCPIEPGRRTRYWDHQPEAVLGTDSVLSAPVIVIVTGPVLARNYQAMIAKPRAGVAGDPDNAGLAHHAATAPRFQR